LQSDQITEVIDGSNFSILHEIILGINEKSLAAEIDRAPTCVHDVDCFGLTPLHWASIVGNIDAIDTLLEAGADINATCKTGRSAIYWASRCNRFKCCENLLAGGADISIRDCDGESALLRLLHGNSTSKNLVTLFIQHGADVNCQTFDNGVSCLMAACINTSVDVCSALIEHGANIETVGHNGETAIVCAISYNRVSTVKLLCEKGAILTRIDDFGESIIHGVARFGGVDIMQILSEAKFEGLRMEHEDFQSYWRIFDYDRDDWFEGERAPIEVERAAFKALLDSIIPATIVESHTELDKINLPGAFPIDEDSMRQDESSSDEDEGDQADFHNAVELQEDIE
jgi:ankyrin repeat protein